MTHAKKFVTGFLEVLVRLKIVKAQDADTIRSSFENSAKEQFVDFLLEEGLVDREDILHALSEYYQVPSFDVVGYFFNHNVLHEFPKDVMLRNLFIPIDRDENMLVVVASEPDNDELLKIIGEFVSYDIVFQVGIAPDIADAIKEYYERALTEDLDDSSLSEDEELRRAEHRMEQNSDGGFYDEDEIPEGFQEVYQDDDEF